MQDAQSIDKPFQVVDLLDSIESRRFDVERSANPSKIS
jgi:hypothetical protein